MTLSSRSLFGASFGTTAHVPEFVAPNTTLLERSDIGCLLVSCAVGADAVVSRLSEVAGFPFPLEAGIITGANRHCVLWLTPRSWIVQCPVGEEEALARRINDGFPEKRVHAALFTDYLCWFELTGAQTLSLLTEGSFLSLEQSGMPLGHAKRTAFAGIPTVFVHDGPDRWLFAVERSRGIYIADWLRAAARRAASIDHVAKKPS